MSTNYEKWIQANIKLTECFESVSLDKYSALGHSAQTSLCSAERNAVNSFLKDNKIAFASLLKERLAVVSAANPTHDHPTH